MFHSNDTRHCFVKNVPTNPKLTIDDQRMGDGIQNTGRSSIALFIRITQAVRVRNYSTTAAAPINVANSPDLY